MYDVEALIPYEGIANHTWSAEWEDVHNVPQLETDQAELQEARKVAKEFGRYYTNVRIIKALPGGERVIVK